MIKVLFVSNDFPPALGGIAQVMGQMCASLPPVQVCVLAQQAKGDADFDASVPYKIWRLPYGGGGKLHSLINLANFAKAAREIQTREKCGLIFYDKAFPLGLISHQPTKPNAPYVVQAYGNDLVVPRSKLELRLQARILRGAIRVIAISHFTRELLLDMGVQPDKIVLMFPKSDFTRFDCSPYSTALRDKLGLKDKKIILSVGRLVRRKGFDMCIRALPKILQHAPDTAYVLVGNGPDLAHLQTLANTCGVADKVHIIAHCSDEDLPAYYHACDVFCMPSRYILDKGEVEGFGIVFLEANACSKPVLGGNSGGQPDAIVDGETGLLCDPESPDDIAEKLLRLLEDSAFAHSMGAQGKTRVKHQFQSQHYGPELSAMLDAIARE